MKPPLVVVALVALCTTALLLFWNRSAEPAPVSGSEITTDATADEPAAAETSRDPSTPAGTPEAARRSAVATDTERAEDAPPRRDDDRPRITGRVVDPSGAPVAEARVFAEKLGEAAGVVRITGLGRLQRRLRDGVRTDSEGRFSLAADAPGPVTLIAAHPAWRDGRFEGTAPADDVEIRMAAGASIHGVVQGLPADVDGLGVGCRKVVEPADSQGDANPLAGLFRIDVATLSGDLGAARGERDVPVAADGSFAIEGLDPDGEYELWAFLPATAATPDASPLDARVCTNRARVLAGARGVGLAWQDALLLRLEVTAPGGAPLETLRVSAGLQRETEFFGQKVQVMNSRVLPRTSFPGGRVETDTLQVDGDTGIASVEVEAEGFRPWSRGEIVVPRHGVVDLGRIELEPAGGITVTVRDARSGRPIEGAVVRAFAAPDDDTPDDGSSGIRMQSNDGKVAKLNDGAATTDGDGRAMLRSTASSRAIVNVSAEGHAPHWAPVAIRTGTTVEHDVTLGEGGTVVVTIVDASGAPVAGRGIQHRDGSGYQEWQQADPHYDPPASGLESDVDGVLELDHLPPGEHAFAALPPKSELARTLQWTMQGVDDRDWVSTTVTDGGRAAVRIELPAVGTLRGTVTLDGRPLVGATVRLERREGANPGQIAAILLGGRAGANVAGSAKTDEEGRYELDEARHGTYRLAISHGSLAMASIHEVDVSGPEQTLDVALRDTVLTGRVLDADGRPIAGAQILVDPYDGANASTIAALLRQQSAGDEGVRTAADGTFELHGVATGTTLTVRARQEGKLERLRQTEALVAGERRELGEFVLEPGGGLEVRCNLDGAVRVELDVLADGGEPIEGATRRERLRSGTARFRQLAPGRYRVTILGASGALGQPRVVSVPAGPAFVLDW